MKIQEEILSLLDETLSLNGRGLSFDADTALLGSLPELDSMAVIAVIHAIEERFGISCRTREIDAVVRHRRHGGEFVAACQR